MAKSALHLLSEEEIEAVHAMSLKLLEAVGVEIDNENVLRMLSDAGVNVDFSRKMAYMQENLVQECLKKTPSEFKLCSFDGKHDLFFARDNVHFNPGSTALYMLDRNTMEMRRPNSEDFSSFVRLTDALEFMHAQSTAMTISDVPDDLVDRYRFYLVLKNSAKPIVAGAFTVEGLHDMKRMLEIVLGGEGALRKRPCLLMDVCPSSPLKWSRLTSQNLIDSAKFNIPLEVIPAPQLGSTAPATLAGLLVQHNAEFLSGLVMIQTANSGIPVVYSGSPSLMDMRYGTSCVGNIEVAMLSVAYAQVAKHYGIPSGAYLGISETKTVDMQGGFESAVGLVLGALGGINCITGPGMLGFENCQSFEKLAVDNEICGMALRLAKGIDVRDETLAFELIRKVGSGGHFLSQKHTLDWFKTEEYLPSPVIDKLSIPQWKRAGSKDTLKRAKDQVDKILKEHHPQPVEADVERTLDTFMKEILEKHRHANA